MAFGYKSIKDQLVLICQNVASVKVVYGKEEKLLKQFPAVCVTAKEHTAEFHNSVSNMKQYQHYVRIYFPVDEHNSADYEDVLEKTADDVIVAIEHNLTLNGSVDWAVPTSGVWKAGNKEVATRMLEIIVTSKASVPR